MLLVAFQPSTIQQGKRHHPLSRDAAQSIFNDFRKRELKPAYLSDADPNRALLDRRVICDLLGFGESVYQSVCRLSAKWCAEPSVRWGEAKAGVGGVCGVEGEGVGKFEPVSSHQPSFPRKRVCYKLISSARTSAKLEPKSDSIASF